MSEPNKSEIARFREQQALEEEAARLALTGYAITARHDFINTRMQRQGERAPAAPDRRGQTPGGAGVDEYRRLGRRARANDKAPASRTEEEQKEGKVKRRP